MPLVIYLDPPIEDIGLKPIIKIISANTNRPIPTDTVGTATIAILPENGKYTIQMNTPGYEPITKTVYMNCKPYQPETCSQVIVLNPVSI